MALPSVTIGGNTQYMNYGIQPGTISYGGSLVMPQTAYAAPMTTYGTSTVMPATTYTTAAPMAATAIDVNRDGRADYVVAGTDINRDGIPDAMETPVTTTYVTQAPAVTTSYAAPTTTYAVPMTTYAAPAALPTTASMVAYPQTQGPFVFYAAGQAPASAPAAPASPATTKTTTTRDVKVAKKKKAGSCASCCPAKKKAPAKKK